VSEEEESSAVETTLRWLYKKQMYVYEVHT